jgi:hypothetical protein
MAKRPDYTDERKAEALAPLAANGGNVSLTARQLGIARTTLRLWSLGRGTGERVSVIRHQKKGELADRLEDLAHRILDLLPGKLATASIGQLSVALGVALDKLLKLRGLEPGSPPPANSGLTEEDRRSFFIALGQVLAPYPKAKQAVSGLLSDLIAKAKAAAPDDRPAPVP